MGFIRFDGWNTWDLLDLMAKILLVYLMERYLGFIGFDGKIFWIYLMVRYLGFIGFDDG